MNKRGERQMVSKKLHPGRTFLLAMLGMTAGVGCQAQNPSNEDWVGSSQQAIVDVPHTPVERQSIGNCWLYAQASWVESMHLANSLPGDAQVEALDISQSYWTYWHWFDQVTGYMWSEEISTGGNQWKSHAIARDRGLMNEVDFIPEDATSEMSNRQSSAERAINAALKNGKLSTADARKNGTLVRSVFDDAWGLSEEVRAQLDQVFGEDGQTTLRAGAGVEGTSIIDPKTLTVKYAKQNAAKVAIDRKTSLLTAVKDWRTVDYPSEPGKRREFLQRVQRALHARQPVVITWDVDFNALDNGDERGGSFNLQTLREAGTPGRQGGHMTVLEDYAAKTVEFGLIEAAKTLDPQNPADAAKLNALLLESTEIVLLRTKNSWGANRPDRKFAKGFPGYHDLGMDYLNGPIRFCPSVDNKTDDNCTGETTPLSSVMLPPGF